MAEASEPDGTVGHKQQSPLPGTMARIRSQVSALAASTHPGPTIAVTAIAAILARSVGLDAGRTVLVTCVVLLNQLSIGLSNDWLDASRDEQVGRTDKATVRGAVSVPTVRTAAITTVIGSLLLGFTAGIGVGSANLVFVAAGWFYNLGLKATLAATLMYAIGFGALPAIVTLARPTPELPALWTIGLGALLGITAHFANVLPDLDDDARTGIRALPHRLGERTAGAITVLVLLGAGVVAFAGPAGRPSVVQSIGLGANIAIAVAGLVLIAIRRPSRLLFRLIILAAIVNVAVLAAAGERMLA